MEIKRRASELMEKTTKETDEQVAEVKRRAERSRQRNNNFHGTNIRVLMFLYIYHTVVA